MKSIAVSNKMLKAAQDSYEGRRHPSYGLTDADMKAALAQAPDQQAENERLRGEVEELQGAQILDRAALRLQKKAREKAEAELAEARAEVAAAYERAATVQVGGYDMVSPVTRATIRALATKPGTTALSEMLDAETRDMRKALEDLLKAHESGWPDKQDWGAGDRARAILARIDQRKETGA